MAAKLRDILPANAEIELDEKPVGGGSPRWERDSEFGYSRGVDFDFPRMIRFMGYGFLFAPIAVMSLLSLIVFPLLNDALFRTLPGEVVWDGG